MKGGGVRLSSGKDQDKQESGGQDSYSGEGVRSPDSFSDEAVRVRTPAFVKCGGGGWGE